jgi:hypothetical protein
MRAALGLACDARPDGLLFLGQRTAGGSLGPGPNSRVEPIRDGTDPWDPMSEVFYP